MECEVRQVFKGGNYQLLGGFDCENYWRKYCICKKIAFFVNFFHFHSDQNQTVIKEPYQDGNSRQFWKKGVDDKQEYFTLMNNETKTFLTAINDSTLPEIKGT